MFIIGHCCSERPNEVPETHGSQLGAISLGAIKLSSYFYTLSDTEGGRNKRARRRKTQVLKIVNERVEITRGSDRTWVDYNRD